ncbi:MAG: NAD(P)/FAD-dependent oxidoreductase [Flavobacteriales bacterium]
MENLSYWERNGFLGNIDLAIIGGGIIGLSAAIAAKKKHPKFKVVVFEKGVFPSGASTKNAGFACFGSLTEIIDDLKSLSEEKVIELIKLRKEGLEALKKNVSPRKMKLKYWGGHEVFKEDDFHIFEKSKKELEYINSLLKPFFDESVFQINPNLLVRYNLNYFKYCISNKFEGQIDTGSMMTELALQAAKKGVIIYNGIHVNSFEYISDELIEIQVGENSIRSRKLVLANNAFAKDFLITEDIVPARAQVLITEPVKKLKIKGAFHYDKGYYYFRNIDNRILLGGARNLNFGEEETYSQNTTETIQLALEDLLNNFIYPEAKLKIENRWTGTMAIGKDRFPIIKQIKPNITCAVKLGGMGVAIGSIAGEKAVDLMD